MFVGGEFYADARWQVEQQAISTETMTFLNGGKACLIVISRWLLDHGIGEILLPSYLCPTIVNTLERCGMQCAYYQVNEDLSINIEDLVHKAEGQRAVYFINYFGFPHSVLLRNYLAYLQQQGMMVVEDNAQAGFKEQATGDFVFNSMRKLVPYDGGYLVTHHDIAPYVEKLGAAQNRRLPVIREYRRKLADYLFKDMGEHEELVRLYNLAEEYYEADMTVEGDAQERSAIEHLDWKGMGQARRENYAFLLEQMRGIPGIEPLFPVLPPGVVPLGLPVYVNGVQRDRLFDELGEAGIGLTVHWEGLLNDPRLNGNTGAVEMAGKMLTLAVDQRWGKAHMQYMAEKVREIVG